jgi:hypothetical protein
MAMTESEYETLLPWQEDLLSRKIHPDSFKEAGDRNYMNDVKAWLTPKKTQRGPSNSIDTIAEELSGHGVEVTPDMIVDFMKDHPSMRVQRGSEFTRDLNDRFSKVASKIAGTDIHGIDSPSGKVFLATYNGLKDKSVTLQDPTDQELGFVDSLPMEDNEDEYAAIKQVIDNTDPEELNNYINSEHEKDRIAKENVGVDAPGQDKEPGEGSKGNEVNNVDKEEKPLTNSMDDFDLKDEDITKAKKKCIPRPKGGVFSDKTDFSIKKK